MTLLDDYRRVRRGTPCPICGKRDWCLVSRSRANRPSTAICARIESSRPIGQAGWLHYLDDPEPRRTGRPGGSR